MKKLDNFNKQLIVRRIIGYTVFFVAVGSCSFAIGKLFEFCVAFISYLILKFSFPSTWHAPNDYICISVSILVFIFLNIISPERSISLLGTVVLSYILSFILYIIRDRQIKTAKIEKYKLKVNELLKKLTKYEDKNVYTMNESELYDHCRKLGLSDFECKIAYFLIIERLKGKELYEAIGYSERQAKRKRTYIYNKLNIK